LQVGEWGKGGRGGIGERGRTHHEGVDEDVVVLEGVEGRGGGDAVLAGLTELQRRHDGGERAEHEVVEHLHGGAERSASGGRRREREGGGIWGWRLVRIYTAHRLGFPVVVSTGFRCRGTEAVAPAGVRVRRAERLAGSHQVCSYLLPVFFLISSGSFMVL
jgi:hypothetical protein